MSPESYLLQSKLNLCARAAKVYQSRLELGDPPKTYLFRVFVDVDRQPPDVVTVYRTSKIEKYWRADS